MKNKKETKRRRDASLVLLYPLAFLVTDRMINIERQDPCVGTGVCLCCLDKKKRGKKQRARKRKDKREKETAFVSSPDTKTYQREKSRVDRWIDRYTDERLTR